MIIFQPLSKKIKDNFFLQFFVTATVNLTDLKKSKKTVTLTETKLYRNGYNRIRGYDILLSLFYSAINALKSLKIKINLVTVTVK